MTCAVTYGHGVDWAGLLLRTMSGFMVLPLLESTLITIVTTETHVNHELNHVVNYELKYKGLAEMPHPSLALGEPHSYHKTNQVPHWPWVGLPDGPTLTGELPHTHLAKITPLHTRGVEELNLPLTSWGGVPVCED